MDDRILRPQQGSQHRHGMSLEVSTQVPDEARVTIASCVRPLSSNTAHMSGKQGFTMSRMYGSGCVTIYVICMYHVMALLYLKSAWECMVQVLFTDWRPCGLDILYHQFRGFV